LFGQTTVRHFGQRIQTQVLFKIYRLLQFRLLLWHDWFSELSG
jgi:hypothetical protein